MPDITELAYRALSVKYQPRSNRYYFDVGIGSVCLSGADSGGAYCLLEVGLAPGMSVPRHTHTREDEAYFVLVGELEVIVGDEVFILRPGDSLMAPRHIPHQLRNSGDVENHYLLVFSPSGFEEFLRATAVPAPDNAAAPTKPPATPVQNVRERLGSYFEPCVRLRRTAPVPSAGSTSRSAPARASRARTGLARDGAPPDSGRSRPTRRDMTRRRAPAPALRRTGSSPGIRACGFDQRECRYLAQQARFPFPPRRCGPGADLERGHDCKASYHLPF